MDPLTLPANAVQSCRTAPIPPSGRPCFPAIALRAIPMPDPTFLPVHSYPIRASALLWDPAGARLCSAALVLPFLPLRGTPLRTIPLLSCRATAILTVALPCFACRSCRSSARHDLALLTIPILPLRSQDAKGRAPLRTPGQRGYARLFSRDLELVLDLSGRCLGISAGKRLAQELEQLSALECVDFFFVGEAKRAPLTRF